jgi:hypothetical protein
MIAHLKPLSRWCGLIRPLKHRDKVYRIVGFDTEDNSKGLPLSFAFHDGRDCVYTTSVKQAIRYVYASPEPTLFAVHNLEYDLGNLFKQCDFIYVDSIVESSKILACRLKGTDNWFVNTASFFPGSLKRMGALVGVEKLPGDVLNPDYVKQDALIVQVFLANFQKTVNEKWKVPLGITIGQMAMMIYRSHYLTHDLVTYNSPLCLEAFYGGRVEMFRAGLVHDIHASDVNSMYPFVMKTFEYPDGGAMEQSTLAQHRFGIGKFTVHVPEDTYLPPLPYRSEGHRLFFPVGTFTGSWTYAEIRAAQEHCPGFQVVRQHSGEGTNKGCHPFREFIGDFYGERKDFKQRAKDPKDLEARFMSEILKLLMNNLFGKWASHRPRKLMSRRRLTDGEMRKEKVVGFDYIKPFFCYYGRDDQPATTANYLWGIHVTSYARIVLYERALQVLRDGGDMLYMDTDSLQYAGKQASLDIGSELGQMDHDSFDLALFRQAKGYLFCNRRPGWTHHSRDGSVQQVYQISKVACKGVPTSQAMPFLVQGISGPFRKPYRLKEALISMNSRGITNPLSEEVGINVWHKTHKEMRSLYIKRIVQADGSTRSVNAQNIKEIEDTCFSRGESLAGELSRAGVFLDNSKFNVTEVFGDVTVPAGWFEEHTVALPDDRQKKRRHLFAPNEMVGATPGTLWFKGAVLGLEEGKNGEQLVVLVDQYFEHSNPGMFYGVLETWMLPGVDVSCFGSVQSGRTQSAQTQMSAPDAAPARLCMTSMTKKYIEVWLEAAYISDADLQLKVCIINRGASRITKETE